MEMERASRNRFRDETDMQIHALYMNSAAALDEQEDQSTRHEQVIMTEKELRIVSVGERGKGWRGNLSEVIADPPQLLCLNDLGPNELTPDDIHEIADIEKAHAEFLETMFPKPSSFEQ
jgi:hypothetical protein